MRLPTVHDGVELRALTPQAAVDYAALMVANAVHLTRNGDYTEEVRIPAAEYARRFAAQDPPLDFGIEADGRLVGAVALVPVDPPRYGLGYWLAESACGRGLATVAVRAVLAYAGRDLNATEIYAGVTHGNGRSAAVLRRAGFEIVAVFENYTRFRRVL